LYRASGFASLERGLARFFQRPHTLSFGLIEANLPSIFWLFHTFY
jgi:hypothetical protein